MPNTYQDIPQPGDVLATSQGDIEHNYLYLANTLGTAQPNKVAGTGSGDHQISIGGTDAVQFEGRHVQVSLNNRGNINLAMPGDGTDSLMWSSGGEIYWKNNIVASGVQMTNNFSPNISVPNGYTRTFLPGGIVIQCQQISQTTDPQAFLFPFAFPTNCFGVTITSSKTSSMLQGASYTITAFNQFGFTLDTTLINTPNPWYYIAMGN